MSFFARRPREPAERFPGDLLGVLERFGRFESGPQGSEADYDEFVRRLFVPYVEQANNDPHDFFSDLQAVVADDAGGYATFGAARLVWELLTGEVKYKPPAPALALVRAGIEFKRAHGLALTFWEMDLSRPAT
ncbi:hypothetical protein [Micromonospora sp. WMMA1947]|uniref:hypothetical protein n=1 Tax=Micromonospora sp. WMMA1947 TaxID=3015163 RepID=UPI00248B8B9C|nr:hypothetical protein [Micromonospora sp. WMMA1947]WBC09362.1 hypothetical protein O7604_00275 [Micromonospora sp. WMMA1947]